MNSSESRPSASDIAPGDPFYGFESGPQRPSPAGLLLKIPGASELFKAVPPEHIFGEHVRCLCGSTHELRPIPELWREDCGRWFMQTPSGGALCYREPDGWVDPDSANVDHGGEVSGEPPGWYRDGDGELVRVTA